MAGGKQQQQEQQGVVAVTKEEPGVARRLWRVVRAVLYMLRRGLPSGRKLAMDLHLLLHRGKIAGKALGDLFLASHHHHGRHAFAYAGAGGEAGPFSCRALDPTLAVHEPAPRARREVEFSCSNTPSASNGGGLGLRLLGAGKRRSRRGSSARQTQTHRDDGGGYLQHYNYDVAEVARMFEMLNYDDADNNAGEQQYRLFGGGGAETPAYSAATSATATPSPSPAQLLYWAAVARTSPAAMAAKGGRTPRLTDSPADAADAQVDRQADEFIRRFYEQLRAQRSTASTPDYYGYTTTGASPYAATPRSTRPVTAGIA